MHGASGVLLNIVGVMLHISDPPGRDHGDVVVPLVLEVIINIVNIINIVGVILHITDPPGRDHTDVVVPLVLVVGATSLDEKVVVF